VAQAGTLQYLIHQYKDFTSVNTQAHLTWEGQSTQAPTTSTIYLQIFNRNTPAWETVDFDASSGADTDLTLEADIPDLTNYKDGNSVIVSRVYQQAK